MGTLWVPIIGTLWVPIIGTLWVPIMGTLWVNNEFRPEIIGTPRSALSRGERCNPVVIMTKSSLVILFVIFILLTLSCSSGNKLTDNLATSPDAFKRISSLGLLGHTVALAPIERSSTTTEIEPTSADSSQLPLKLNLADLSDDLIKTFNDNKVFQKIEKLSPLSDTQRKQIKEARGKKASLLMRVSIKKARVYRVGTNSSALLNTALWFLIGPPSWWSDDTDYGVEISAEVSFLDVASSAEFATLLHSFETTFKIEGGLSFLERSASIAVVILPPPFCPDNIEKVHDKILPLSQELFLIRLAEQTKTELGK